MFGFWSKKNREKVNEQSPQKEKVLSNEEISEIKQDINKLTNENTDMTEKDYEEIGLLYAKLGEQTLAIQYIEKSMAIKPTVGEGYKQLMALYNSKRAEAAKGGDLKEIDIYLNKMDELRQIARKYTIGN